MPEAETPSVETRDIWPRAVWLLGLGFALFVVASTTGLLVFFRPNAPWAFDRLAKPEPVLQVSPAADYAAFAAEKRAQLLDTGWRDREAGLVEIPIEKAMRLVAQGHRAEAELFRESCRGAACPDATPTARTIP